MLVREVDFMKAIFLILLSLTIFHPEAHSQETLGSVTKDQGSVSQEVSQMRWVQTMEASIRPTFPQKPELSSSDLIITWMGWATALVFFLVLLSLHLKIRRREQLLIRAGERDLDIFPPARNRRRFPR